MNTKTKPKKKSKVNNIKESNSNIIKRSEKKILSPNYLNIEKTIEKIPQYSYRTNNEIKHIIYKKENEIFLKEKENNFPTSLNRKYSYSKISINHNFEEKKGNFNKLKINWSHKNLNEAFKIKEKSDYVNQINQLNQIINILFFYIKKSEFEFYNKIKKVYLEKNDFIKKLEIENKMLINENKNLKLKLLELFYYIKSYEKNEMEINNKKQKLYSQIIKENIYLRKSNSLIDKIDNSLLIKLNNEVLFQKEKKLIDKNINDNYLKLNNVNNNQLIFENINNDDINLHKRQKTVFFNLNEENMNLNNKSISSESSINTIINNNNLNDNDLLEDTLKEMTLNNKTLKRNKNSKRNILELEKKNLEINNINNSLNSSSKKQQQLYYRLSKEDNKKILFTK